MLYVHIMFCAAECMRWPLQWLGCLGGLGGYFFQEQLYGVCFTVELLFPVLGVCMFEAVVYCDD